MNNQSSLEDDRLEYLLHFLRGAGYGWAKFANSVETSNRCTEAQAKVLERMYSKITTFRVLGNVLKKNRWVTDWDDHSLDAQSAGYESNDIT